jgi:hypothetical protein
MQYPKRFNVPNWRKKMFRDTQISVNKTGSDITFLNLSTGEKHIVAPDGVFSYDPMEYAQVQNLESVRGVAYDQNGLIGGKNAG